MDSCRYLIGKIVSIIHFYSLLGVQLEDKCITVGFSFRTSPKNHVIICEGPIAYFAYLQTIIPALHPCEFKADHTNNLQ